MKLSLPGLEDTQRLQQLESSRKLYKYKWFGDIIPRNENGPVPGLDTSGPQWFRKSLQVVFSIRENIDQVIKEKKYTFANTLPKFTARQIADYVRSLNINALTSYYNYDPGHVTDTTGGKTKSINDYGDLFKHIKSPQYVSDSSALSDEFFSRSFIAGANPVMVKRMLSIPANFPMTDQLLRAADANRSEKYFATDSIQAALAQGRLFMVDYSQMESLAPGKHPSGVQKYVYGAVAVFAVPPKKAGMIRPFSVFAIKGGQSRDSKIFSPHDGWSWAIAKGMVNASHYTYHETVSHLGVTHLVIEPILTSMRRQLAKNHPIYHLLNPHFEGTRSINHLAFESLIQPGKAVDRLIGCDLKSAYSLLEKERLAFNFEDNYLPNKFRLLKLNAADGADLPEYPYRDDGLDVWQAINKWTTAYVNRYYSSDTIIIGDDEIQSWATEVSDMTVNQGGGLLGFGTNSKITTRKELAEICTMIIFTAGPQHAAVNFTQKTDMEYLPATPLAGYIPEIKTTGHNEQDFLNFLPPIDVALVQISNLEFLGGLFYTSLGKYQPNYFEDATILAAMEQLQKDLAEVENKITTRNKIGSRKNNPYLALMPSRIPQSINI
ncbi:MAG: hypothetical protein CMP10_15725 [Zetaproteobacteria bacterium]|nr:hypothetical protein [Pseudobdellovibrionaceae bacterium]